MMGVFCDVLIGLDYSIGFARVLARMKTFQGCYSLAIIAGLWSTKWRQITGLSMASPAVCASPGALLGGGCPRVGEVLSRGKYAAGNRDVQ